MHSEGTNVCEDAQNLWVQADVSPDYTSTCAVVGGEEMQQKRVRGRLGTVGGIGKGERVPWLVLVLEKCWYGGKTGQRGKDQSAFGDCPLEQRGV